MPLESNESLYEVGKWVIRRKIAWCSGVVSVVCVCISAAMFTFWPSMLFILHISTFIFNGREHRDALTLDLTQYTGRMGVDKGDTIRDKGVR